MILNCQNSETLNCSGPGAVYFYLTPLLLSSRAETKLGLGEIKHTLAINWNLLPQHSQTAPGPLRTAHKEKSGVTQPGLNV